MSETSTTAMLVGTREMFGTRSNVLAATVSRSEIEEALALDPPAELILDVDRKPEGTDGFERRTVNVAWTRKDLESLLDHPAADAITFSFDADELERAIAGSEVEGHGLRETAAVLTIAAAAAAAGASGAFGAIPDERSLAERGIAVEAAAPIHTEAGLTERGIGIQAVPPVHDEMTATARGIDAGTPPAVHDEATLAGTRHRAGNTPGRPRRGDARRTRHRAGNTPGRPRRGDARRTRHRAGNTPGRPRRGDARCTRHRAGDASGRPGHGHTDHPRRVHARRTGHRAGNAPGPGHRWRVRVRVPVGRFGHRCRNRRRSCRRSTAHRGGRVRHPAAGAGYGLGLARGAGLPAGPSTSASRVA